MVRYLFVTAICLLLAGCGGDAAERPAATTAEPHPARPAPGRLLAVERLGGVVATSETLYVHRDGVATLDRRHGGAGRRVERFRIAPESLSAIRRGLDELQARPPHQRPDDPARVTYTLWAAGRSYRAQQGVMERRERPLFRALESVINGYHRQ